jgi:hypothetical protein
MAASHARRPPITATARPTPGIRRRPHWSRENVGNATCGCRVGVDIPRANCHSGSYRRPARRRNNQGLKVEQTPGAQTSGAPDTEHRNMSTANKIRLVQTILAAVVAAFAISVVVAGHWWTTPPPPPPSVNLAVLKDQVVGSLRTRVYTDDLFKEYEITVDADLTLINTDLNKYEGLATVHTRKGTQKFLAVTVTADPTGAMMYRMDPASVTGLIEAAKAEKQSG